MNQTTLQAATNTITGIISQHDLEYEDIVEIFSLLLAQHLTVDNVNEARQEITDFSNRVLRQRRVLLGA